VRFLVRSLVRLCQRRYRLAAFPNVSAIARRRTTDFRRRLFRYLKALGPGIVSGASDADPTTVATMSVVGATTTYRLSWLTVLVYPMLANVQVISARVGLVTNRGLQELVRRRYGRRWGIVLLIAVLAVNLVTLAADLEAGAAALGLVFNLDYRWFALPLGAVLFVLLVAGSFTTVERVLKYVLLVMFAYVAAAFLARPGWMQVLDQTVQPHISFEPAYVAAALAVLGTTLTSYAYVWEVVEESERKLPIRRLGLAQADAALGMLVAVAVFWFILVAAAATAGVHHHSIETAQDAANALQPVAGAGAKYLFAVGLLASACIAVPVLAATTAYLASAEFEFPFGLSKRFGEAVQFYSVVGASLAVAIVIALAGIPAVRLLYAASIAGALGTPISLVFLLLIAQDRGVMRGNPIGRLARVIGWATTAAVAGIGAWFLAQQAQSAVQLLQHLRL
jgi:Mn2+/Fe2+ NRAMP family transporter